MILFYYCASLCLLSAIPIIIIQFKAYKIIQNNLKHHLRFFLLKIVIISMFIYIFISNLNISNTKLFIIVGCFIFVLFHFIEGFILQKKLLKNGK